MKPPGYLLDCLHERNSLQSDRLKRFSAIAPESLYDCHFTLATSCALSPGPYADASNFTFGIARPWSWAVGSSTIASQRLFDYGRLPSESPAFRVERELGASGKRPNVPEANGAKARALFGGLRIHGQRGSAKERAM
jgi:hypothetical protein